MLLEAPGEAGLPKPTLVRLFKVVTLDETIGVRHLGTLGNVDRARVASELARMLTLTAEGQAL